MALYSKLDMYGFADFYHRFCQTGLTMDEMLHNFSKYSKKPRDLNEPIKAPKKSTKPIPKLKPHWADLMNIRKFACEMKGVTIAQVDSKIRKRAFVDVRQWVCYVGMVHGFEAPDFLRILKWDRTGVYHKSKKCIILAESTKSYRQGLNQVLTAFGHPEFIA